MQIIQSFINRHKTVLLYLSIGVLLRILASYLLNYFYDYFNILALAKSVADTGNLSPGFFVTGDIQLYGKIYYQIIAAWMQLLQFLHVIDITYIFDTKTYNGSNYLAGLFQFSPPLFQLVAVKFVQLLFDGILVYYLYRLAQLIQPQKAIYVILFWALNPIFIFTAYAQMQSDIAMVAFLVGGVYYAAKAMGQNKNTININIIASLVFLIIGAIIKQVPLLFVPIVLVLFVNNIKQFAVYLLTTVLAYFIVSQPWSNDSVIIKHFFLYSKESLALFRFGLNEVPFFLLGYSAVVIATFFFKKKVEVSPVLFIKIIVIVFSIIYLVEESGAFFYQFNSWILPFLALLAMADPVYVLFFIAPLLGYFKRIHIDTSLLTSSLATSISPHLAMVPDYRTLLAGIVPPVLLNYLFQTLLTLAYICLLIYALAKNAQKAVINRFSRLVPYLNLRNLSFFLLTLYLVIFAVDFLIKSQYVLFESGVYAVSDTKIALSKKPIRVDIHNPNRRKIKAVELQMNTGKITHEDYFIMEFIDKSTKKSIYKLKMNDLLIPIDQEDTKRTTFFLKKSLNNKDITVNISEEHGTNPVYLYGAVFKSDGGSIEKGMFSTYLAPENKDAVTRKYTTQPFMIELRGQLPIQNIFFTVKHNLFMKRSFYLESAALIITLLTAVVLLSRKK